MPPKPSGASTTSTKRPGQSKGKSTPKLAQKTKPAPKQPLPVPEKLKRLFTSLCAQIDGGHFSNAMKTCDKILRLEPHDKDALQTKLFLLLQTEQYSTALSLISEDSAFSEYEFEKAYSLYRLHRELEAMEALDKTDGAENRGVLHLEAQLAYRQGSYQTAFDLYNQLLDTAEPQSEEQSDILTNLEASQRHLDFITAEFLQALDSLPTSISNGLEAAPPPPPASSSAAAVSLNVTSDANAEADTATKPKTVRMKRVPKGVIPGVTPPPDPERWLKKSERSTYGQGKRRRGGGGGGATQGSVESAGAHQGGKTGGGSAAHGKGKRKK